MRWLTALTLAAAVVVAVIDLAMTVALEGEPRLLALGEWWAWLHRESLLLLQPAIERYISPALWYPWIQGLLEAPAAVDLLGLAAVFWLLERLGRWRRRRRLRRLVRRGG